MPIKKPWTIATNCPYLVYLLPRFCDGCHEHAPCQGVDTKVTEGYTPQLVSLIHKAWALQVLDDLSRPLGEPCRLELLEGKTFTSHKLTNESIWKFQTHKVACPAVVISHTDEYSFVVQHRTSIQQLQQRRQTQQRTAAVLSSTLAPLSARPAHAPFVCGGIMSFTGKASNAGQSPIFGDAGGPGQNPKAGAADVGSTPPPPVRATDDTGAALALPTVSGGHSALVVNGRELEDLLNQRSPRTLTVLASIAFGALPNQQLVQVLPLARPLRRAI